MLCSVFYKEDDDTTVVADGFPLLNALRDVHLLLTQGAHNQYGDLPWTARQEFLMQQWILARPEMREFLPRRIMVDYPEPWMDSVETMKTLQGWTDTSILHFRDLAIFGEQILLSIRFGEWTAEIHPENAANWARYWRPEIQGYIYAYRAATGVDLAAATVTGQVNSTIPAVLLRQRLRKEALADGAAAPAVSQDGARAVGGRAARTRAIGSRTAGRCARSEGRPTGPGPAGAAPVPTAPARQTDRGPCRDRPHLLAVPGAEARHQQPCPSRMRADYGRPRRPGGSTRQPARSRTPWPTHRHRRPRPWRPRRCTRSGTCFR